MFRSIELNLDGQVLASIELSFRFIIIFLFQQHLGPGIGEDDVHLHLTPPSHALAVLVEYDTGRRSEWREFCCRVPRRW